MKIIAFYLPQFHETKENNEWWGKGFTEWVNVRKAKPLYENHYQPRVPLNGNYYNLLNVDVMREQIEDAKSHGLYGFCMYHYWFSGKLLLEKPVENYLNNKELDFPFCLCWANENWTNTWAAKEPKILIGQDEGNADKWEEHFQYLINFFLDERYIRMDGKPLLVIYKPDLFEHIGDMLAYWDKRAKEYGLKGLAFASQLIPSKGKEKNFDFVIEYQPTCINIEMTRTKNRFLSYAKHIIKNTVSELFHFDLEGRKFGGLRVYSYDDMWKRILSMKGNDMDGSFSVKRIPGAFVDWDNTPRKGRRGYVIDGASPDKFKCYLKSQILNARENYKSNYIFMFAWNEWAEGGYLEPDEKFGYGYLEAVREALMEMDELE